jgi:hypothetical protein
MFGEFLIFSDSPAATQLLPLWVPKFGAFLSERIIALRFFWFDRKSPVNESYSFSLAVWSGISDSRGPCWFTALGGTVRRDKSCHKRARTDVISQVFVENSAVRNPECYPILRLRYNRYN